MTKERLEQYRKLREEVDRLNRLATRQVRDTVKGSRDEHPFTEAAIPVIGLDARLTKRIRRKRAQAASERQAIAAFVEGLEDVYMADLIRKRYLEQKTWVDIWKAHSCSGTVDSYRKTVSRYLDK